MRSGGSLTVRPCTAANWRASCAPPFGLFPPHIRRALRGPVSAASCRRSNSGLAPVSLRSTGMCVLGTRFTRAVRGAEHRSRGRKLPEGARRWIAALAKQYMDVLSEQPGHGEKHRAVRIADAKRATAPGARPFWLLFGALRRRSGANGAAGPEGAEGRMPGVMPKSNPLPGGERKLWLLRRHRANVNSRWIPAFAGMTSKEEAGGTGFRLAPE
jgi:hypothetical protein